MLFPIARQSRTKLWLPSLISFLLISCSSGPSNNTLRSDAGQDSKVSKPESKPDSGSDSDSTRKPPKEPSQLPPEEPKDEGTPKPEPADETETPVTGLECSKPSTVSKIAFCESTVEGIAVKWIPLEDKKKPTRIALYLHGDTANDWRDPFIAKGFAAWAKKNNVLIVMPRSTAKYDGDAPEEWSYGAAQAEDAEKLEKMVKSFITKYQTPSDNLLYFGVSGGPWFLSSSWIPLMAGKYPGLFALSCGGSQFWQKFAWDVKDAALRDKVKILYNFGDQDFLAKYEEQSYQHYLDAGIATTKKVHPGATHCDHDIYETTIAFWEANLR